MIQRISHLVKNNLATRRILLTIRYNGTVECEDDLLLMIGEAWYQDIRRFGGDPLACMQKIHEAMKDWPVDRPR